jgi:kynureninase
MSSLLDRSYAEQQDRADPLARLRDEFHLPTGPHGATAVYLCGHSLGLQPKRTAGIMQEELDVWARLGVEGHFAAQRPWVSYHELLTPGLAMLAGALPHEVVAMNTLTVNLHLMLASFYRPHGERRKIVSEKRAFSSDRYAVVTHLAQRGIDPASALVELEPRADGLVFETDTICDYIERHANEIATVLLPGVQYLTGQCFDMARIAATARRAGCTVGFDLAHAMGNVPLQLHDWDVDFAAWCGYKYLNGGPGALGGCFVHERHAAQFELPRLAGWWGHDKSSRFAMPEQFVPLHGAEGWQIFERAGVAALRAKSLRLTAYLEQLLERMLPNEVAILTPRAPEARGCQLSLRILRPAAEARAVHDRLTRAGYVCDWREPDVVRVAPVPLYNTFADVWEFAHALRRML